MKDKYIVPSDRYHRLHSFVRKDGDTYDFVPEEDWMPIYVTFDDKNDKIHFIDTEGGPCISEGFETSEIRVSKINLYEDGSFDFTLIDKEDEKQPK